MNALYSKRNTIEKQGQRIIKTFAQKEDWAAEVGCYHKLAGTGLTPEVLSVEEGRLEVAYCEGALYFDAWEQAIAEADFAKANDLCQLFAQWYQRFQKAMGQGWCLGDSHFRNFILTKDGLLGVDFETVTQGAVEADVAHLAIMLASCNPVDSPVRREFGRLFLATMARTFACDRAELLQQLTAKATFIGTRRNLAECSAFLDTIALLQATLTVTGVVVAGGRSSRMSQDKRTLRYHNQTLLTRASHLVAGFYTQLLSQRHDQATLPPLQTVADLQADCGPMGGIASTLPHITTPYALYIPCDMPLLTSETIHTLLLAVTGTEGYLCYTQEGRMCTFPLLLQVEQVGQEIEQAFARGEFALYRLLKGQYKAKFLTIEDCHQLPHTVLNNVNTPQALKELGGR